MKGKEKHHHRPKQWVGCDIEEHYFGDDRKSGKQDRKLAQAKDRSKYKKTDQDKLKQKVQKATKEHLLRGRVLSIVPEGILVDHEGHALMCSLRGVLKKEKSQFKNLVTVGDFVLYEAISATEGLIEYVEPRHSTLSRADNISRRKEQLIAANIDQVLITVSVVEPPLKPFLADRYIIAARKGGMEPVIVVNKIDLLEEEEGENPAIGSERELLDEFVKAYTAVDVPVILVSTVTGVGIEDLKAAMKGKASVFSGQSGVGKSSLINAMTGMRLEVREVVDKTKKGLILQRRRSCCHWSSGAGALIRPASRVSEYGISRKMRSNSIFLKSLPMGGDASIRIAPINRKWVAPC